MTGIVDEVQAHLAAIGMSGVEAPWQLLQWQTLECPGH
jgi:hypothetical protein